MALTRFAKTAMHTLAAVLILTVPSFAQQKLPNIFTVSNVRAEADAADSVEAKRLATVNAETRAFWLLMSRLGDFRALARLPQLSPEQVQRLVADIDVRGEGVSGTSYVATFGVTFSERAVAGFLAQYGVIPIVDRGPEILIVPVYIEDGSARAADRNPWRNALLRLDLAHALVAAKVAPARGDLTAPIANAYAGNPAGGLETLKSQYRTGQLLLAIAEVDAGKDSLTLKLIGSDALGPFALQRRVKARDGVDETLMQTAARLAFETVQQRWKLTRDSLVAVSIPSAGPAGPASYSSGTLVPLQVTAQFSGLKEWQSILKRLQSVPGLQNWDVKSVNPRSAQIGFDFPGGAERLTAIAAAQGLSVEEGPEGLIVKTR
jgi:hypothetical protein